MHDIPLLDIIERAGLIGYLLVALSVTGTAIAVFKVGQMVSMRLRRGPLVDDILDALARQEFDTVTHRLDARRHPVARMLTVAITAAKDEAVSDDAVHAQIDVAADAEVSSLQAGFRPLAAIVQLSPLIGLLGTVTGMIAAFSQLQLAKQNVDPSLLAGGIWQALLTTAMGLAIAIPLRAVLYFLEAETEAIVLAMRAAVVRALIASGRSPSLAHSREGAE